MHCSALSCVLADQPHRGVLNSHVVLDGRWEMDMLASWPPLCLYRDMSANSDVGMACLHICTCSHGLVRHVVVFRRCLLFCIPPFPGENLPQKAPFLSNRPSEAAPVSVVACGTAVLPHIPSRQRCWRFVVTLTARPAGHCGLVRQSQSPHTLSLPASDAILSYNSVFFLLLLLLTFSEES